MNYKLAKQLKDAGFPQGNTKELFIKDFTDGLIIMHGWHRFNADKEPEKYDEDYISAPNLEEVIEELGDKLESLQKGSYRGQGDWIAHKNIWNDEIKRPDMIEPIGIGKTPLEAVSNLYIKLNQK